MEIVYLLAPLALLLAVMALVGFLWAVQKGQYDDLETPAHRMLLEENNEKESKNTNHKLLKKKEGQ